MEFKQLKESMEKYGYSDVEVKKWKTHDWLLFKNPPNITYGRIVCTGRIEEVPDSSWMKLFSPSIFNGEVRKNG